MLHAWETSNKNVTDAVLRELRDLTSLAFLNLSGCTLVTDVGVRELHELTTLITLGLHGCTHVTDVGIQHLSSLTKLTHLYLDPRHRIHDTRTTQAGRNALKAALPTLTIHFY